MAEELWSKYGNNKTLAYEAWPTVDQSLLREDTLEYPVSFNGKMRFLIQLPADAIPADAEKAVLADERSQKWLEGKTIRKFIFVPKKIINLVIG